MYAEVVTNGTDTARQRTCSGDREIVVNNKINDKIEGLPETTRLVQVNPGRVHASGYLRRDPEQTVHLGLPSGETG